MYELASRRNRAVYFCEEEAEHESVGINMSNSTCICEDLHLRKFCQGPPSRENICLLSYSWFSSSKCRKLSLNNVCFDGPADFHLGIIHSHNT